MSVCARLLAVLAPAFVLAACGTATSGAARTTPSSEHAAPTTAGNERRAQLDAPAMLAKLNLPVMAVRSPIEPKGDEGVLRALGELIGNQAHAVARAWWTLPGSPGRVLAYVKAHPPVGAKLLATGSVSDRRHGVSSDRLETRGRRLAACSATASSPSRSSRVPAAAPACSPRRNPNGS